MINRSLKMAAMLPDVLHCDFSSGTGYAVDWHAHDCHMLLLPRRGSLLLSTEDSSGGTRLSNLSFSAIDPDVGHATSATSSSESHLTLYVDPHYLRRNSAAHATIGGHGQWGRSDMLDGILSLYDRIGPVALAGSPAQQRRLHHLNHLLFDECMRIIASEQRIGRAGQGNNALLIRQVQQFIDDNLADHHHIDTLCAQFHLSRRHLTRLFREVVHESVVDYANRRRVEHARKLIGESAISTLQAGLAVGIDSPSYLARLFRKHLGLLPSECRKRH